jgi:Methyltransferase domain
VEGSAGKDRLASIMLPRGRAFGNDYFLETILLVAAAKIVDAKRVFEFGTYHGTSSFNLALNLPADGEVYTLDLPDTSAILHAADLQYAEEHLALSAGQMDYVGSDVEYKIKRLAGNSREFDFSPFHSSMDLVFIDAGHDLETAVADTKVAFGMARQEDSCILWHDYRHPDYPELTQYLEHLADSMGPLGLVHIAGTMYCCWFSSLHIC